MILFRFQRLRFQNQRNRKLLHGACGAEGGAEGVFRFREPQAHRFSVSGDGYGACSKLPNEKIHCPRSFRREERSQSAVIDDTVACHDGGHFLFFCGWIHIFCGFKGQRTGQGAAIFRGKRSNVSAAKGETHALAVAIPNHCLQYIKDTCFRSTGVHDKLLGFSTFYDKQWNIRAQLFGAFQILHHISKTLPCIVFSNDDIAGMGIVQLRLLTVILQLPQTVGDVFACAGQSNQSLSVLFTAADAQFQSILVGIKADGMHQLQLFDGAIIGKQTAFCTACGKQKAA